MTNMNASDADVRFSLLDMEDFGGGPSDTIDIEMSLCNHGRMVASDGDGCATCHAEIARRASVRESIVHAAQIAVSTAAEHAAAMESAPAVAAVTDAITEAERGAIVAPVANEIATSAPSSVDIRTASGESVQPSRGAIQSRAMRPAGQARETNEQRTERERSERDRIATAALDGTIAIALRSSDGTYPHGCLVAWRPSGDVSYAAVYNAAQEACVEPPAERSAAAVASDAVSTLAKAGLRVETVKRGSRWTVYRPARVISVGESIGAAMVTAELRNATLTLDGPDDLCAVVRTAWDSARVESRLTSQEVTAWLVATLKRWRAVPTCYGRWLPPGATDRWCVLARALSAAGLPVPAAPAGVASREDIRDEIRAGLISEVDALVGRIANARDRAVEESKGGSLGSRAAATALQEIADLREKLSLYELLTGSLASARASLDAIATELAPLVNDTAQRGAVLEMD